MDSRTRSSVIIARFFLTGDLVKSVNPNLNKLMTIWAEWQMTENVRERGYELPTFGCIRAVEGDLNFHRFRATVSQAVSGEALILQVSLTGNHPNLLDTRKCRELIADSLTSGLGTALQRPIHWSAVMPEKAVDGDQTIDFFKVNALFNPSEALQSPHAMALLSTLQRVGTHAVKSDTVSKWMHLTTLGSNGQQAARRS